MIVTAAVIVPIVVIATTTVMVNFHANFKGKSYLHAFSCASSDYSVRRIFSGKLDIHGVCHLK